MAHILVVEDDKSLNKSICLFLQQRGFIPQACFDGEEAFQLLYKHSFDIILCDIMMPVVDGFQLINHVRQLNKEIPIIMMTAKEDFQSKATLFNSGVDDYMVKPLNLQELELRIRALLRRANINVEKKLVVGNCTLDLEEHSVYVEDEPVKFTTREFDILLKFLTYPKKTFSRPQLMNEFWNPDNFTGTRTGDVYISCLRTSLLVYGFVFISISFIITCSIILFLQNAPLEEEFIRQSAPRTFGNVFILSFVMTAVLLCMKYWFLDHPQQGQTQSLLEEHQKKLADFEADFISNVSHEMKTPLAVISNYTTLLQTSNLEHEERDKYLSIIQTQISKLSSMMTNILKLNKLEQRTYDLELKEISISEFVCQCILSFEHIWQEKNITIETELQEPLLFVTDQQLLELVLNNLLSNAFKFTDHGGLVSVTCYRQDHELVIQVRDTGCGISDQTGRHIFERFYQGDTSHKTEGNGLGLALVRQIIDVLTGEISVSSQLGKGTTFCIHLKELC